MNHPLDDTLLQAGLRGYCPAPNLRQVTKAVAKVAAQPTTGRRIPMGLLDTVTAACVWLTVLGVEDPDEAMRHEYDLAVLKHPGMTLDANTPTDDQRLAALVEELGEVARALTYDRDHAGELTREIAQLGALAAAWAVRFTPELI